MQDCTRPCIWGRTTQGGNCCFPSHIEIEDWRRERNSSRLCTAIQRFLMTSANQRYETSSSLRLVTPSRLKHSQEMRFVEKLLWPSIPNPSTKIAPFELVQKPPPISMYYNQPHIFHIPLTRFRFDSSAYRQDMSVMIIVGFIGVEVYELVGQKNWGSFYSAIFLPQRRR